MNIFNLNKVEIFLINIKNINCYFLLIYGDWGLGIGDWGLGIGDWAQSPIPNPHQTIKMSEYFRLIYSNYIYI